MKEILDKIDKIIEEETEIIMTVFEDERGTWHGEITTLTEDGYFALLNLLDDLHNKIGE